MTAAESQEQLYFALQTFTEVNRIITSSHNSDETLARTVRMIAKRIKVMRVRSIFLMRISQF